MFDIRGRTSYNHDMQNILFILSILVSQLLCGVEVKKANVDDVELAYYTRGSGDPLVMIMGFRGTMSMWDPAFLEELEKKYTLILFDNRGVGFSTDSNIPLTIAQMAKDTAGLIQTLGFKKAHILGWSMGSRVAMELALNHSEVVDRMILCSPNPGGSHQARRNMSAFSHLTGQKLTPAEGLALIFPDTPEGKKAGVAIITRLMEGVASGKIPNDTKVSEQIVERQLHALRLWDQEDNIYEKLPQIKVPTLVAGGLADVIDSPENVQLVSCQIPFAWSAYYPGAGHDFLSQNYKSFSELVILFIESYR